MKQLNLLEGKIFPTMIRLAAPLMGTAFIQMFYTLTDMAWIGRISTEAVAAAGLVGFLMWIGSSITLIPRVGSSVLTAQYYGRHNYDTAKQVINNGSWLAAFMGIIYGAFLIVFRAPLISFYQLSTEVNVLAEQYLVIIAIGMPLFFINPVLSGLYNSLGNSRTPFRINSVGLVMNIIGDPILIFGLGPLPALGIRGAAIATVLAQVVVFVCFVGVIIKSRDFIFYSKLLKYMPNRQLMIDMIKLGFPVSLQSNIHAFISVILNRYVAFYGAMPLAVASVGANIESISWMTTEGFASAITAFTGQNYGAKQLERIHSIFYTSIRSVGVIGIFATGILLGFRYDLFKLFMPNDPDAIALGAIYLFIFGLSQFFMSIEIGASSFLNGLSDTRTPALLNTFFNILRIPMALLFMPRFKVAGVWIAMSLSSVLKGIILYIVSRRRLKKVTFIDLESEL